MAHKSYYLYQRYIKIGDQDWVPTYPMEFSVSGDSEDPMPMVMKMDEDPACGGIPPMPPIYRWHQLPISEDYECSAGTKYYKEVYQVSYDNGLTWEDVVPEQTRRGDIYETGSSDCIEYRWTDMDISTDYICDDCPEEQYRWTATTGYVCSGVNKMTREIEEVSYDSGTTWTPTGDERAAYPLIEADSEDCGYVPPTPAGTKWLATYTGGTTSSGECDSTSSITENEVTLADLESVLIGNCVNSIGRKAFSGCSSLTSIDIPNTVTSISGYAFQYCSSLTSVTIPDSVTSIGGDAFGLCSGLTGSLIIPDSVTSIGSQAFMGCSGLTSVTIGSGITSIGFNIFFRCSSLTSVTIPNSVTSIGSQSFSNCSSLTSITIPDSVTSIGYYSFSSCSSLTSVTIPNSVTIIDTAAFRDCISLTSIIIPNSVTTIGNWAFMGCSGLTSVTIGSGVTSIGERAFYNCSSLTSVAVEATTPPALGSNVFQNTSSSLIIYVPALSLSAYQSASGWDSYSSRIQAIP